MPNQSQIVLGDRISQYNKQFITTFLNEYCRKEKAHVNDNIAITSYKFKFDHK